MRRSSPTSSPRASIGHRTGRTSTLTCDPASIDRLRRVVSPFDRSAVATVCGITEDALDAVVELVARPRRLSTITGTGVSMGPAPNATEWLTWALSIVTGSLDRRGGILFNPGVIRPQAEAGPVVIERETGPRPRSRPDLMHAYGEYPSAILADEILSGEVRAVLCFGGNIASSFPDSAKTNEALRSLEVFAVSDLRRTRTAELATHLLPTCGQLERHDVTFFLDQAFPIPFAQYTAPVVEPVGDRRELWRVWAELARRMGIDLPRESTSTATAGSWCRTSSSTARVPFEALEASPSGVAVPDLPAEWLVPAKLPRGTLDVAPAGARSTSSSDGTRAPSQPVRGLQLICRRLPHQMNSDLQDLPSQQRAPHPDAPGAPRRRRSAGARRTEPPSMVSTPSGETHAVVERTGASGRGSCRCPTRGAAPT